MALPLLLLAPAALVQYYQAPIQAPVVIDDEVDIEGGWDVKFGEGEGAFQGALELTHNKTTNAVGGEIFTEMGDGKISSGSFVDGKLILKGSITITNTGGSAATPFDMEGIVTETGLSGTFTCDGHTGNWTATVHKEDPKVR